MFLHLKLKTLHVHACMMIVEPAWYFTSRNNTLNSGTPGNVLKKLVLVLRLVPQTWLYVSAGVIHTPTKEKKNTGRKRYEEEGRSIHT